MYVSLLLFQSLCETVLPQSTESTDRIKLVIGVAAAEYTDQDSFGWSLSGGAINLAIERLNKDGYAQNFDFEFLVNYTECDRALAAAVGIEFMQDRKVDAVIGPPCENPLNVIGAMSTYYRIPLLVWGLVADSQFTDADRYPFLTNIMPNARSLGFSIVQFFQMMEWDRVALYYEESSLDYPKLIIDNVESAINDATTYTIDVVLKQQLPELTTADAQFLSALKKAKSSARIIISSLMTATSKRRYLEAASSLDMLTSEYVHIFLSLRSVGFGKQNDAATKCELACLSSGMAPFWEVEGDSVTSEIMRNAATRVLIFDLSTDVGDTTYIETFTKTATLKVVDPPVSCATEACKNAAEEAPSTFSRSLHDLFYLYGMALSSLVNTNQSNLFDPHKVTDAMILNFQGLTGEVSINANNSRVPKFVLYAIDKNYDQTSFMNLTYSLDGGATITIGYKDESELWYWYDGKRPLNVPACGYSGNSCPLSFMDQYGALLISLGSLIALAMLIIMLFLIYVVNQKRIERERIKEEWQIAFEKLQKPPKKDKERQSRRSLQSGPSTITDTSKFTLDSEFGNYTVYYYENDAVLTTKHPVSNLQKHDYDHFVRLRKLDHDNVNKFIGISIDSMDFIAIWKMCIRGSLHDIIVQGNFSIDPFFMFCIIRDIAEGLKYIHSTFLNVHANLRSATVLVNESWQAKLTDFGLGFLLEDSKPMKKRQLWQAPEVLRDGLLYYQIDKSADIYSFAIISSEILTRKHAWNLTERKESVDELVYLIKKQSSPPIRPDLELDGVDVNASLLHLVRDCWKEDAQDRPTAETVSILLRDLTPNKNTNLMDHVFNILEEYTTTLELEVEERTKELSTEKKKADILLGRMLPRQVAERLKQGQTVEPEGFDSVTVFFSDVVKFTQLAAKCSPFQVVNLLNDLYSNFDSIIEEHGVYKVESIGDGYLCVSGLPVRNGFAHIKQIIEMSLNFMSYVASFKIPHIPRERVELRIGVNSGPCVAGVVGLSMPRYCLFGDTVNTASRMESNGKASHIHISGAAHTLLVTHYPNQYETHSRGDVIIKGKGVMETFWVNGRTGEVSNRPLKTPPMNHYNMESEPNSPISKKSASGRSEGKSEALYRQFLRQKTMEMT